MSWKRRNLFYFENAISFTIIWLEQKKIDKVFLVKQTKPGENMVRGRVAGEAIGGAFLLTA